MSASITVLCGGLGAAWLALGLQAAGLERTSTFVTNVADDLEVGGLLVCPDTDSVLYALAGCFNEERGWGVRGDTFPAAATGIESWFAIGHEDRSHHERRRDLLDRGLALGEATAELARGFGIDARVVPATDDPVRTAIDVEGGRLAFQEWLVRRRAKPRVLGRGVPSSEPR